MKENAIGSRRHAGHMLCLWTGVSLCACGPAVEGQDEAVFAAEPALSGTLLGSGKPVAVPAPGAGGVSPKAPPKGGSGGSSGTGAGSAPAAFLGTLPEVGFTPSHRAVLLDTATYTSPWYRPSLGPNGAIEVNGTAKHLPAGVINGGNYEVRVNGVLASVLNAGVGPDGGMLRFQGYADAVVDPFWVHRQITVEVINTSSGRVLARAVNTIYDHRREAEASVAAEPGPIVGMAAHLMDRGIGDVAGPHPTMSLETPHLGTLPLSGMTAFNQALEDAVRGSTFEGQPTNVCFGLDDVPDGFHSLPQYHSVYAEALALYAVHEAWKKGGEEACVSALSSALAPFPVVNVVGPLIALLGCGAVMSTWCVTDVPQDDDFELCIGRVDGDPQSLSVDRLDDVQLELGAGTDKAVVEAEVAMAGIHGTIDGLLRDIEIRWAKSCDGRPMVSVPDSAFDGAPEADAAATCPELRLEATHATTAADTGAVFSIAKSSQSSEALRVTQTASPVFSLVAPTTHARSGLCSEIELWSAADEVALAYEYDVVRALQETWDSHADQAEALELLLQRFDFGTLEHDSDRYELSAAYTTTRSDGAGADFAWNTEVTSLLPKLDPSKTMYYHPAAPAPFSPDGADPNDELIDWDLAYTFNTGYLNQVISEQSKTELLTFRYMPSWEEVGRRWGATAANTGHAGKASPPLDGAVLARLHSAFAELGSRALDIVVYPTIYPLAWMNPDPPLADDANLAVGVSALEVVFAEPAQIDPATGKEIPGLEWLRVQFNLRETDFEITLPSAGDYMAIPQSLSTSHSVIVINRFTGCPMVTAAVTNPCEPGLVAAVGTLIKDLIEPRLLGMLSRLPSPRRWDAGGASNEPVNASTVERRQMNQNITYLLEIEDT